MLRNDKDTRDKIADENEDIISLDDLAPEDDVTGGKGTVLFGQRASDKKTTKKKTAVKKVAKKQKKS